MPDYRCGQREPHCRPCRAALLNARSTFGAPLLEHILLSSKAAGIERFVIVVGYRADAIRRWFADHALENVSVTFVETVTITKRTAFPP